MLFFFVLSSLFILGDAAFVASLPKCSMNDSECHRELLQVILRDIGKTGIEELGIPPIDPVELKNVSISIADLVDVTLVDGVGLGVKDCKINSMVTDIPGGRISVDILCDITVKGHYKASSSSPLIKALLGKDYLHGDGYGKVRAEKIHLKFDFKISVSRGDDGEVYLTGIYNATKYQYEFLGDIAFAANNIFLGDEDISEDAVRLLNQSAKSLAPYFGATFIEKALEILFTVTGKFFRTVPTRLYLQEDLTPYIHK
ncbi:uncharacterized protein [Choristoneura fumiferana]